MNIERSGADAISITVSARERDILLDMLRLYPLVPATHHRLSQAPADTSEENQHLLEEALAEQRGSHQKEIAAFVNDPARFQPVGKRFKIQIKPVEVELLLQVLNDVRVGSWLALGQPDADRPPEITEENFRYSVALEVCGLFQSAFLAALGQAESPDWL